MTKELSMKEHFEIMDELFETDIKEWYIETYPTDELGHYLNEGISFFNLFGFLAVCKAENLYSYIGEADSVIRERLFAKLAKIMRVPYDEVYKMWVGQ